MLEAFVAGLTGIFTIPAFPLLLAGVGIGFIAWAAARGWAAP